jgi:hypothetical protein
LALWGAGPAPSDPSKEEEFQRQMQEMIKERESAQRAMERQQGEADAYRKTMKEKILALRPVPKPPGEAPSPAAGPEPPAESSFPDGLLFPALATGLAALLLFAGIRHLKRKRVFR